MTATATLGSGGDWRTVGVEWRDDASVYFASSDYGDSFDLGDGYTIADGTGLLVHLLQERFRGAGPEMQPLLDYLLANRVEVEVAEVAEPDFGTFTGTVPTNVVDGQLRVYAGPSPQQRTAYVVLDQPKLLCQLVLDRCSGDNVWPAVTALVEGCGLDYTEGWTGWPGTSGSVTDKDVDRVAQQMADLGISSPDQGAAAPIGSAGPETVSGSGPEGRDRNLWSRLPLTLTKALARDRKLRVSSAAEDLTATAGDPPSPEFVAEVWPVLVENWLVRRPELRAKFVAAFQPAHLGPDSVDTSTRAGELEYLARCTLDTAAAQLVTAELVAFAEEHIDRIYPPGWTPPRSEDMFDPAVGRFGEDGALQMRVHRRDDLTSYLDARLARDGSLVISGHDIGEAAEVMGRDEYEYTKTFAPGTIPQVLEALGEDPAADVMEVIAARWCGDDGSFEFERRIREADVPYEFWSY